MMLQQSFKKHSSFTPTFPWPWQRFAF